MRRNIHAKPQAAGAIALVALALCVIPGTASAAGGLNLSPDPPLLIANMVIFALLIWPVNRLLVKPMLGVIEQRESRTTGALERAGTVEEEARTTSRDLDTELAAARATASETRAAILSEGEGEERRRIDAAREVGAGTIAEVRDAIAGELEEARNRLRSDARALARDAAAKILGRPL